MFAVIFEVMEVLPLIALLFDVTWLQKVHLNLTDLLILFLCKIQHLRCTFAVVVATPECPYLYT